ncbi:hypothetical protein W97_01616 [Coniosporium apollinis CBS 100218]|uniref:AB hydrolase-1 domain-containing protein n=1 Tax=Coniosporium apollinis (strain CBS 100218) TaxID=1168221 RepID=R7YKQ2_CONA1|nr:uncharacterized protein W97_01616 [Coniosporium apollinis CBS 100218]EON62394.1 hypothetical protein W97_01616 [Coniosporium apollinis CBS 100218]
MPYILFLHGFPSSHYDWRYQIPFFAERGYGIIAPDLLGYGGTDKPTDPGAYRMRKMSREVAGILDCEGIESVHGVGHDWGSPLLSRMANYFPERFRSYTFIDVGYIDPSTHFNREELEEINAQGLQTLGYAPFGYFFYQADPSSAALIDSHFDSFFTLWYTSAYQPLWITDLTPLGALERWLKADRRAPLGNWTTEEDRETHRRIFIGNGGYQGALKWYTVSFNGLNVAEDNAIPPERALLDKPVLLLAATRNPIGGADFAEALTRPFAPDLRVERLPTGHWIQLEAAYQTNVFLESFFLDVIDGSGAD